MIPAERRARIVDLVKERRAVRVSSLSEDLGVSGMTIRRDLERLEVEGVLVRTHGGAVLKRHISEETLYVRARVARAPRRSAASPSTPPPSSSPARPSSSARAPRPRRSSGTSTPRSRRASSRTTWARVQEARGLRVEVVLVGGLYRPRSNAVSGPLALEHIGRFHAGKMLIGVDGFDLEEGLTTPTMGMAGVERAMIAQTRGEVIALADASKIGVVADVVICGLDQVDTVMVDDGVDESVRDEIVRTGTAVHRRLSARELEQRRADRSEVEWT